MNARSGRRYVKNNDGGVLALKNPETIKDHAEKSQSFEYDFADHLSQVQAKFSILNLLNLNPYSSTGINGKKRGRCQAGNLTNNSIGKRAGMSFNSSSSWGTHYFHGRGYADRGCKAQLPTILHRIHSCSRSPTNPDQSRLFGQHHANSTHDCYWDPQERIKGN